jgi:hypothetical protein
MKNDFIIVIQNTLSRESGKKIILSNEGERTVNSYRVYVDGNKTKLILPVEQLIWFETRDISQTLETLKEKGDL